MPESTRRELSFPLMPHDELQQTLTGKKLEDYLRQLEELLRTLFFGLDAPAYPESGYPTFTEGSIIFAGPGGGLAEDNANLFWNDTSNFMGVGTNTPNNTIRVANLINFDPTLFNTILGEGAGAALTAGSDGTTVVGYEAAPALTDVPGSVIIGYQANYEQVSEGVGKDVIIGYQAAYGAPAGTTPGQSVIIGYQACYTDQEVDDVIIGYRAGYYLSSTGTYGGQYNVYIGSGAGEGNSGDNINQGYQNVFIGYQAGNRNQAGYNNVAVGSGALLANTDNDFLVAIGKDALGTANGAQSCTAVGHDSCQALTTGDNNAALGSSSMYYNQTGSWNTVLGSFAGEGASAKSYDYCTIVGGQAAKSLTTGSNNVILGYQAAYNFTDGFENVIIGNKAAYSMGQTPTYLSRYNVIIGSEAGYAIDDGTWGRLGAVIIGYQAGYYPHTTGSGGPDVFIGYQAGRGQSGGMAYNNIAIGNASLIILKDGYYNISIGYENMHDLTDGTYCTSVGHAGLAKATTSIANTTLGYGSGHYITTGSYDTFIGCEAGFNCDATGEYNTTLGHRSGYGQSGNAYSYNTLVGAQAGYLLTTGSSNNLFGFKAGYNQTAASNLLIIDNQLRASANREAYESILYGTMASTSGAQDYNINADVLIRNDSSVGSESLNETAFTTHANWDVTGDFDDTGGNATYTHSTGVGTLTQTSANMAVAGVGSRWYRFTYTCSGSYPATAVITSAFASDNISLPLNVGTHTVYFLSAAAPGDFVISVTSAAYAVWILDDFSLKQLTGGDLIVNGDLSVYGTGGSIGTGITDTQVVYSNAGVLAGDSALTFNDSTKAVSITSNCVLGPNSAVFQPAADSATFFQINDKDGNNILTGDTVNNRIGICSPTPSYCLDVGESTSNLVQARFLGSAVGGPIVRFERTSGTAAAFGVALPSGRFSIIDLLTSNYAYSTYYSNPGFGSMSQIIIPVDRGANATAGDHGMLRAGHAGTTGTDTSGGNLYLGSGLGNGAGAASSVRICLPVVGASGTTQQTYTFPYYFTANGFGINTSSPETWIELTASAPYLTLHNNTHEDADGGRESKIIFKGERSGGEENELAQITIQHDGTADDDKGEIIIATSTAGTPITNPGVLTDVIKVDGSQTTYIGDAGTTNYAQFDADGELTLVGTARVIKHLNIPIDYAIGASAPTARVDEAPFLSWTFAVNDDTHHTFMVPHDFDFTQDANIYVEWYTSVDQTDDEVQWQVSWNAKADGEAVNAGATTDDSGDIACPTQWLRKQTLVETIPGNSIAADDCIGVDLTRIAIDDGTAPAVGTIHVLGFHFEYVSNKLGEAT